MIKIEAEIRATDDLRAAAQFLSALADTRGRLESEITSHEDALSALRAAGRATPLARSEIGDAPWPEPKQPFTDGVMDEVLSKMSDEEVSAVAAGTAPTVLDEPSVQAAIRKRGQPSPGKKRRTAAEVAEDDAANAADAVRAKQDVAAEVPQISTGEARVGPEDTPEVEEQDRADEAAETAATKTGLTHDDVRQAVGRYNKRYGMAASVKGIPAILGKGIHELEESELAGAIQAIDFAIENGPETPAAAPVVPEPTAPPAKPATKEDVQAAMIAYAKKFDGPDANPADPTSVPFTLEDAPKVFQLVCGEGVTRLSAIPVEKYGAVIAGLEEAIAKDPFKRGAK